MPSMDFNFPLNLSDSITLSVSPEQLNNTAATISDKINNVNNTFSDINQKINGMRAYWEGYVSEDKVNSYNKQSDNKYGYFLHVFHDLTTFFFLIFLGFGSTASP